MKTQLVLNVGAENGVGSEHGVAAKLQHEEFAFSCAQGDENAEEVISLAPQEDPERIRHETAAGHKGIRLLLEVIWGVRFHGDCCWPGLGGSIVWQLFEYDVKQWDRDVLDDMFNTCDIVRILNISLSIRDSADSWYWRFVSKGLFSVKSCHRALRGKIWSSFKRLEEYLEVGSALEY